VDSGLNIDGQYITAVFGLGFTGEAPPDYKWALLSRALGLVENIFASEALKSISGIKDDTHILSHLMVNNSISDLFIRAAVLKAGSGVSGLLSRSRGERLTIGLGRRVQGALNVAGSYQEAIIALQQFFFSDTEEMLIHYNKSKDAPYVFNADMERLFSGYLKAEDKERAVALIKELAEDIRRHKNTLPGYVKNIFYNLLLALYGYSEERGIAAFDGIDEKEALLEAAVRFDTLNGLRDFAIEKLEALFHNIDIKNDTNKVVYNIMKYVQKSYADSGLSIRAISRHLYLTNTYICMLFKNTTGKTINEYITETRLERAKELLKSNDIPISDIAGLVGYGNPKYFSAVFKKMTGLTPSEYRERH
jgi:two-component system response regulator YesN